MRARPLSVKAAVTCAREGEDSLAHFLYDIVGMENSAPSFTPDGQREVTVFVFV